MRQRKNPHQRIQEFILTNRGTVGTPKLFALATGMDVDSAQIVLWDLERGLNPLVIEKPSGSGIWGYNPGYRHHRQDPLPAQSPATPVLAAAAA